ncbi:uncharacterized protein LOC114358879 [Ostrinia furnacalis]|uniref:uncharacterized protein LOC114358879 n=1 Tax=Ostrinia furnacalis TaxID=93504 RepID=UPI00103D22C4|nr:uncharacterized protein LOC114358879 [Ostrinia furnacalis]
MGGYSSKDEIVVSQAQSTASGGSASTVSEVTRTELLMGSICLIFFILAACYIFKKCIARGRRAMAKELGRLAVANGIPMTPAAPATATPAVISLPSQGQAQVNPAFIP